MNSYEIIEHMVVPTHNKILVKIEDTYDIKNSKGGILMPNAAHEEAQADAPGFNLSEWIIRKGTVAQIPKTLTKGTYDWSTEYEISVGDEVYWPIVMFFNYPVLKIKEDLYIVIDYHDIYMKKVGDKITPINGYYMFTNERKTVTVFEYTTEEPTEWYHIEHIGKDVEYEYKPFNYGQGWEVGDRCILAVPPFRLESITDKEFDKDYYLAQKRHILLSW